MTYEVTSVFEFNAACHAGGNSIWLVDVGIVNIEEVQVVEFAWTLVALDNSTLTAKSVDMASGLVF